jgi:cell division protease FtsH
MAGGYTMSLSEDMLFMSRSKFRDVIAMALGGRVAEELVFDEITTGASNDLDQITKIARNMVTRYGMSERLGPMIFGQKEELVFLGREIGEQRDYSEAVAEEIDAEVRRIVSEAYERARTILTEHRDKLELIAQTLLTEETLDREAFERLMTGEGMPEAQPAEPPRAPRAGKRAVESPDTAEDTPPSLDLPPKPAPA